MKDRTMTDEPVNVMVQSAKKQSANKVTANRVVTARAGGQEGSRPMKHKDISSNLGNVASYFAENCN